MRYNGIDDNLLLESVRGFEYEKVEKGNYVFREGDQSKTFYGIIKGLISIRIKRKEVPHRNGNDTEDIIHKIENNINISNKEKTLITSTLSSATGIKSQTEDILKKIKMTIKSPKMSNLASRATRAKSFYVKLKDKIIENEDEITQLTEGLCFGEWALIYNQQRKASALALEDTHLFSVDKYHFDRSFSKSLIKAEAERKSFILNIIPFFNTIPRHKFEEIYRQIIVQFYSMNQNIYKEGDKCENLYMIYQGEANLKRDVTLPYKMIKSKEDKILLNNNLDKNCNKNVKNILRFNKGNIGGLEICAGLDTTNHTLVAAIDFTVILTLNLNKIYEYKSSVMNCLLPLYLEKENIIENYVKIHRIVKNKMKIHYPNENKNKIRENILNKNNLNFVKKSNLLENKQNEDNLKEDFDSDDERHKKVKEFRATLPVKVYKKNAFKFNSMEFNLTGSNYFNTIDTHKKVNDTNSLIISNNIKSNKSTNSRNLSHSKNISLFSPKHNTYNNTQDYINERESMAMAVASSLKLNGHVRRSIEKYSSNRIKKNLIQFDKNIIKNEISKISYSDIKPSFRKKMLLISHNKTDMNLISCNTGNFNLPLICFSSDVNNKKVKKDFKENKECITKEKSIDRETINFD